MSSQYTYINNIDECVDNIIDTFYLDIIGDKQLKKNIFSTNFILDKFDTIVKKVNDIVNAKVLSFKINEIITNHNEYENIIELLNNYSLLYLFFYLGTILDLNKIINLINNLSNKYHNNIFKNKYLTQYSIYYSYIKDYQIVLNNISKIGIESQEKEDKTFINKYKNVVNSIKLLDKQVILNISKNEEDIVHNILKIIIFKEIYIKEDKVLIFKILENEEFANAESKYIEIVDSKFDTIDYSTIENLFNIDEVKKGLSEEVYHMINEYEMTRFKQDYSVESKINLLFKKKILIPITDEFLRYHKDLEMFEKTSGSKIDPKEKITKKGETKIRYIVTRINRIKDYYSPKILADPSAKTEIEHYFYQPLMYRKAIIINDIEEINILRKLELQGKSVTESNEFYEDLKNIRTYPYIEFKFTNKDSFSFSPDSTIDAIRYCNFEFKDDPKFPNINNTEIQYRVINNTMKVNIVGVAIPRFNLINTNDIDRYNQTIIPCHLIKDTMNMNQLHKNGFEVTLKKLKKLFLEDKRYSKMLYWLFNKKKDIIHIDLFDNINQLPKDDYIKLLLGKIYDEMVNVTYNITVNQINSFKTLDIDTAKNILHFIESKTVLIPRQSQQYAELMKLIYYLKIETDTNTYDNNEDKIPGIGKIIKLPRIILEKIALHIIRISKAELLTDETDEIDMYEGYVCQHVITWNKINNFKRSDPNRFNQELFSFIKKYVTENKDNNFVCKSCYQLLDLSKYTTEIYPGSDSIAISYGLENELETIPEYVKYNKSIKNMDKMIEKICYGANISYFVGSIQQTKLRRQEMIKNIIDMVDVQYKTLYSKETNIRKERVEKSIKNYGCSMTNFFLFKLENEIFTYSSKETDKFKLFKINNILTYMLIAIILEINLSQILYFSFDKLVNYFLFTKFGFNLFDNLYIRISNKNDIAPIKNYKMLCYVIYYLSGIFSKYDMWFAENIPYKPNNINPQIQRIIIHTFVDAINSILEVNSKENKHYLYNMFAVKFFNKLNSVYDNDASKDVINKLDSLNKKKVIITSEKKLKYNIKSVELVPVVDYVTDGKYMMSSMLGIKHKITSYPNIKIVKEKIKDLTKEQLIGEENIKKVSNDLYLDMLYKTAILYGSDGIKRNVPITIEESKKLSLSELKKIYEETKNVRLNNTNKIAKKIEHKLEKINTYNLKNKEYVDKLKKQFNGEISDVIKLFIDKLESLIGKDININNNNFYLNNNAYVIDHDYRGNKKSPIIILEKDNKIKFKKDDKIFNQDIYYYDDNDNQVTMYYSAIEKYLIGYKENSKNFIKVHNTDCYLKIHYSLLNQLRLLGFNYLHNKIDPKIKDINQFVNNILRIRLQNLKNALSDIQQIIYQIKNNYSGSTLNPIAKYYQTKIKDINTYDNNSTRIFVDWNIINSNLYYKNIDASNTKIIQLPNKNNYVQSENLLKYMSNVDIILYYIIEQSTMLLDINTENYTKISIAYLLINIIFQIFRNLTNIENAYFDINVKKFYRYISTKSEVSEIHDETDISKLSEEELEKLKEQQDIEKESWDAIDADQDEINEDFGDEEVQLLDRSSGEY